MTYGSVCWFCHWGWHPEVKKVYDKWTAIAGYAAMHFGPAHIVWEDENFDSADWCLEHFDEHRGDHSDEELVAVKQSLIELNSLPMEWRVWPTDYDGKHPENYPPSWRETNDST